MVALSKIEEQVQGGRPVSLTAEQRAELGVFQQLFQRPGKAAAYRLVGPDGDEQVLPESLYQVLKQVVAVLARGDAVTIVPVGQELTTQQAAGILNVSRQYVVRLLESGKIPFTKTGTHRRVLFSEVMRFKQQRDAERAGSLDELTRLSEDYGGYDEIP